MIYHSPKDQGGGGTAPSEGEACLPSNSEVHNPEVQRLKDEVRLLQRRSEADGKTIAELQSSISELQTAWEADRAVLQTWGEEQRQRALNAEREVRIIEDRLDEIPGLRERCKKLEGIEEAVQQTAEELASLSQVLGQAVSPKAFRGKSPLELVAFVSAQIEVVKEGVTDLRNRNAEIRDRSKKLTGEVESLKNENQELRETLKGFDLLQEQFAKLDQERVQQEETLAALRNEHQRLLEDRARADDMQQSWLKTLSGKEISKTSATLQELASLEEADYLKTLHGIRLNTDSPAMLNAILAEFGKASASLEEDEASLDSPQYEELCRGKIACEKLIIDYLHHYDSIDLLLELDSSLTSGIVDKLSEKLALRLLGAYLANPKMDHITGTQMLFSQVEKLPPATHAAIALNNPDSEEQLALLFGTPAVRAGVNILKAKLSGEALKKLSVSESQEQLHTIIQSSDNQGEVQALKKAQRVLGVLEHIPDDRWVELMQEFGKDAETCSSVKGVLGFDFRYVLSLVPASLNEHASK